MKRPTTENDRKIAGLYEEATQYVRKFSEASDMQEKMQILRNAIQVANTLFRSAGKKRILSRDELQELWFELIDANAGAQSDYLGESYYDDDEDFEDDGSIDEGGNFDDDGNLEDEEFGYPDLLHKAWEDTVGKLVSIDELERLLDL